MSAPIAIWNWQDVPQPPRARVVVCRPGLRYASDDSYRRVVRAMSGTDSTFIVAETSWASKARWHWPLIPALYAERQADLSGVGALLTVNAERRALVLCPREELKVYAMLREASECAGLAPIDLVVLIPPPEARTCEACGGVQHVDRPVAICTAKCGACNGVGRIEPWPLHPAWVRSIVEQCRAAGVPVAFLGWGRWLPWSQRPMDMVLTREMLIRDGNAVDLGGEYAWPVGEERSGSLLGGAEVMELPEWLT